MELQFNESRYNSLKLSLEAIKQILTRVKSELITQGVKTKITLEDLKNGQFVAIFNEYHKAEQSKKFPGSDYLEYLRLYGRNTELLQNLENEYSYFLDAKYEYYKSNDSFYSFCYGRRHQSEYSEFFKNAPDKVTYSVFDLVKISKDKFSVDVPKDLFILQTTSKKQIQLIENIEKYVELSKNLNVDYKLVKDAVGKYINNISREYVIEFNYNEILTVI